jgi:RimJ/RimL family protein N-acetyltransferase
MTALTSRLVVLRPHTAQSFERLHQWKNDREILELSADSMEPSPEEKTRRTLERWMKESEDIIHFAIHRKDTDELIGFLHLALIEREHQRCKIGLVIGEKQYWGQGYGTDAVRCAVDYGFSVLGLNRISAEAYATNPRSVRMLERAGFQREGVLRESILKDGAFVDEYCYALLRRQHQEARR